MSLSSACSCFSGLPSLRHSLPHQVPPPSSPSPPIWGEKTKFSAIISPTLCPDQAALDTLLQGGCQAPSHVMCLHPTATCNKDLSFPKIGASYRAPCPLL